MADKKQNGKNNKRRNNGDEDFNPRFRKARKKVCVMCSNKDFVLDYKNPEQLKKFINEKGKILPRRATGACAKHQCIESSSDRWKEIIIEIKIIIL